MFSSAGATALPPAHPEMTLPTQRRHHSQAPLSHDPHRIRPLATLPNHPAITPVVTPRHLAVASMHSPPSPMLSTLPHPSRSFVSHHQGRPPAQATPLFQRTPALPTRRFHSLGSCSPDARRRFSFFFVPEGSPLRASRTPSPLGQPLRRASRSHTQGHALMDDIKRGQVVVVVVVLGCAGDREVESERGGGGWRRRAGALGVQAVKRPRTMPSGGHRTWAFTNAGGAAGREGGSVPTPKAGTRGATRAVR